MRELPLTPPRSLRVSDTANSLLQNRINISIIFNYLRDHGVAYRASLARDLGISAPAVSRAIEKLLKDEYVIESEKTKVENGKKAAQVSVNAERGYVIGVDLMADPIKIAVSDFGGVVRDVYLAPPFADDTDFSSFLIAAIDLALKDFERKTQKRKARILAIAVGVPAVVDPQTGAILSASLYESISKSDFPDRISGHFEVPVFIENTANLSAIGEWKCGIGRGARNLVFIEVGSGIGAGIILDGDLYRGAHGAAGEIGYFITEPCGLGYDSSACGYLESRSSLGVMQSLSSPEAVGEAAKHLELAIINLTLLLNPEIVVIGGAMCELPGAGDRILKPLIEDVVRHCPLMTTEVRLASLGANASLIGAVQFALDSLVVHAYPYRL